MDISDFIATLVSAVGLSAGGAWYLSKQLIEHRLTLERERQKTALAQAKEQALAELKEELRLEVDTELGERAADRQYRFEARQRLYRTIGPIRFQLVLAAIDLLDRIAVSSIYVRKDPTERTLKGATGYFGRSTVYRLLRLQALSEVLERQIAYADFAVDPSAVDLLTFGQAYMNAITGHQVVGKHPGQDWENEIEHAFSGSLRRAAGALVVDEGERGLRVMSFSEFETKFQRSEDFAVLDPFPRLIGEFSAAERPIMWIRFCCLAYLSSQFVRLFGPTVGLAVTVPEPADLLSLSRDTYTQENTHAILEAFGDLWRPSRAA